MRKSTNKRIVYIDHHDNQQDDLAWSHIADSDFNQQLVRPFEGQDLGQPDSDIAGVIIYGGSHNVGEQLKYPFLKDELRYIDQCMKQDIPILGICLGAQLIAHHLGAKVTPRSPQECEFGYYPIYPTAEGEGWVSDSFYVTQAHFEEFEMPREATLLASSVRFPNQAFRYGNNVIGLQFHPEVTAEIFRRWQVADWAMYGIHGAQTKSEQDQLIETHSPIQEQWFRQILDNLFSPES